MAFNRNQNDDDRRSVRDYINVDTQSREVRAMIGAGITLFFMLCNFHLCLAVGEIIFMFLHGFFGWLAYIMPLYIFGMYALKLYKMDEQLGETEASVKFRLSLVLFVEICWVVQLFNTRQGEDFSLVGYFTNGSNGINGGLVGGFVAGGINHIVGPVAAWLFVLVALMATIYMLTELNAAELLAAIISVPVSLFGPAVSAAGDFLEEAFPKKRAAKEADEDYDDYDDEDYEEPKPDKPSDKPSKEENDAKKIAENFFSRIKNKNAAKEETTHFEQPADPLPQRNEDIHANHFKLNYGDSYNRTKNLDYLSMDLKKAYPLDTEPRAHIPTDEQERKERAASALPAREVKKEEAAMPARPSHIMLQRPHLRFTEMGFSKRIMDACEGDYGPEITSEKYKPIDAFIAFNGSGMLQTAAGGVMTDIPYKKEEDLTFSQEFSPFADSYEEEKPAAYDSDPYDTAFLQEDDSCEEPFEAEEEAEPDYEEESFPFRGFDDEDEGKPESREASAFFADEEEDDFENEVSETSVPVHDPYDFDPEDYLEEDNGPDGYDITADVELPEDGPILRETKRSENKIKNASIWAEPDPEGERGSSGAKRFNDIPKPSEKKKVSLPYVPPRYELIKKGKAFSNKTLPAHVDTQRILKETLDSFGVGVEMGAISVGPSVTRYEILPHAGVKVSRIVGLQDDIKLALAAADVRIEAPIPGKSAIGIEVPNTENATVGFRDLIESDAFRSNKSKVAVCVGRDIAGNIVVADLAKMPHLLIAGATGSGKSVCINTLIMSLLYKATPDEVKLIMVDPKVVELSVYNGIPHLLIPVVTDPRKAANALKWAVDEMDERYNKLAEFNVRNLQGYNERLRKIKEDDPENDEPFMYQMVIIVDELADLMMVASQEVEEAICRLAQKARAAGIHLVLATQRPSVNVITGLIKANVPSRIAFAVSSGVDSRTIIDQVGAEKLLGKGDMLYHPYGLPKPVRVQGAFISDEEVTNVVEYITKHNGGPSGREQMEAMITSQSQSQAVSSDRDEYFYDAGRFIIEKDKASIGALQRNFRIGFNRAARIMDQLFEAGVVGEEEGTKPRKILMDMNEFDQIFGS